MKIESFGEILKESICARVKYAVVQRKQEKWMDTIEPKRSIIKLVVIVN